jgi:hypothetical protein
MKPLAALIFCGWLRELTSLCSELRNQIPQAEYMFRKKQPWRIM